MAGGRVDDVPDNVFATSSRINSTWGGALVDMVRSRRILEVVEEQGLIERVVIVKHALRNALIPFITIAVFSIVTMFGGAIITENLFGVNGIGSALIQAIRGNDLPMVQTLAFIFAILIVMFNLIADLLYGMLDPRIRYD